MTFLKGQIQHMKLWKAPKVERNSRKLDAKQELILCLLEDLAYRFGISSTLASNIFLTWVWVLSQYIATLVFNPPKEVERLNLPPPFQNGTFYEVRHIVDFSREIK